MYSSSPPYVLHALNTSSSLDVSLYEKLSDIKLIGEGRVYVFGSFVLSCTIACAVQEEAILVLSVGILL
jgi:hypothetical protein